MACCSQYITEHLKTHNVTFKQLIKFTALCLYSFGNPFLYKIIIHYYRSNEQLSNAHDKDWATLVSSGVSFKEIAV